MNLKSIRESANNFFQNITKKKLILVITSLLGFPTLSFSSYVIYSRTPLSFIDALTVTNFFTSFYLSVVFSIALARIITFIIESFYRFNSMYLSLPKRLRHSKIFNAMNTWGEKVGQAESLSVHEFGEMAKVLYRYERYRLKAKFLADKKAVRLFQEINSYYFIVPIAFYTLSVMFAGAYLTTLVSILYVFLPFIGNMSLNRPEDELDGIIRASIGMATYDFFKNNDIEERIPLSSRVDNGRTISIIKQKKLLERLRSFFKDANHRVLEDLKSVIFMLKSNYNILTFVILFLGVASGISKYKSDILLQVQMETDTGFTECVSPLLTTANHTILYSHGKKELLIIPYEMAYYKRGADCPSVD